MIGIDNDRRGGYLGKKKEEEIHMSLGLGDWVIFGGISIEDTIETNKGFST